MVDGDSGSSQFWVVTKNATVNVLSPIFWHTYILISVVHTYILISVVLMWDLWVLGGIVG